MKYFSLALALFVCAAVVSAAPPSSDSFENLARNPLDEIKEKLNEWSKKLLCALDVIQKNVDKTEIQHDFDELKEIADAVWQDMNNCEDLKCKLGVVKALPIYLGEFFERINRRNRSLAKMIRKQVVEKCMHNEDVFGLEDARFSSLADALQCMVDVLGKVSNENGLQEIWTRNEAIFQHHIDNLRKCPNVGRKILVILCNIHESIAVEENLVQYIQSLEQKDPKIVFEVVVGIQQDCAGRQMALSEIDIIFKKDDQLEKIVEKLMCVLNAIKDAVMDTDFRSVWIEIEDDLKKTVKDIKACKNGSSKSEIVKCIRQEIKIASQKLLKVLNELGLANREALEHARANIQMRCN